MIPCNSPGLSAVCPSLSRPYLALIHVSPRRGSDFGGCLAPGSASLHLGLLMVSALRACFSMNTIRLLVIAHSLIGWTGWTHALGTFAGAYKIAGGRHPLLSIVSILSIVPSVADSSGAWFALAESCHAAGCKPAARSGDRRLVCVCGIMSRCKLLSSALKARPKIAQGKRPQGASPWVRPHPK